MTKAEVRTQVRGKKRELDTAAIEQSSELILKRLYSSKEYKDADAVYTYVSYNQEVMTHTLIEQALSDGKRVAVPKVQGKEMEFYYIASLQELKEGYQHILEPITTNLANPSTDDTPLMILPGLAFDKEGGRIGYGGGFYDRYLQKWENIFLKCALGFSFQLYDRLETEAFDISVDLVITPDGMYYA